MKKLKKYILSRDIEFFITLGYHLLFLNLIKYSPFYLLMFLPHIAVLLFSLKVRSDNNFITKIMSIYNYILYGNKGKGKDLITQLVIAKRFKKVHKKNPQKINYTSNVDYGYGFKPFYFKDLELSININNKIYYNGYRELIDDALTIVNKNDSLENLDVYISDGGIYLPSTEDSYLNKVYHTFPIAFALSRQLYNMLIGINTQALSRVWLKLREQQEAYIKANGTIPLYKSGLSKIWPKLPYLRKWLFIKATYYENYDSALKGLLPFSKLNALGEGLSPIYLTSGTATKQAYESEHGRITDVILGIRISDIKYDSRIFHKIMFGKTFSDWDSSK